GGRGVGGAGGGLGLPVVGSQLEFGMTFSGDGKWLLVSTFTDVYAFDMATGKSAGQLGKVRNRDDVALGAAVSPDGRYLAQQEFDVQKEAAVIRVRELKTGKVAVEIPADLAGVQDLRFAPDGKTLGWTLLTGGLHVYELGKDKDARALIQPRQPGDTPTSFCLAPDSKLLAAVLPDRTIAVWEVATGKEIRKLGEPVRQGVPGGIVVPITF